MEIFYVAEAGYEKMAKNNSDGRYDGQLKWYNAMKNLIKSMTTEETPKKKNKNKDVLKEYSDIALKELETLLMNYLRKQEIEKKIVSEMEKSINKALSKYN